MDRVTRVVGVSFIRLTIGFTLIFAKLIARDRIAVPPNYSIFPPQSRTQPSEFGAKGANMPSCSTGLLRTILL